MADLEKIDLALRSALSYVALKHNTDAQLAGIERYYGEDSPLLVLLNEALIELEDLKGNTPND